ncbi:MAG: NAD(P)-binding protein [Gammaproteobacteria bacterium]|nr:NAD(P)-binding protein [Gammaproteobacteria bacterium]
MTSNGNMSAQVIVVGGGIAGLTTALALSQVGISSLVLERSDFEDETGAGIQLTPNATRVLFQLGLEESLVKVSHEPQTVETRHWKSGKVLCRIPLQEITARYCSHPYLQIHRSELVRILRNECEGRPNIELMAQVAVEDVEQSKDRVSLYSSKGKFAAPMVVGADGTHSIISKQLGNIEEPKYSQWQAWRTVLKEPSLSIQGSSNTNVWCGTNGHIVHYPVNVERAYNFVFVTKSSEMLSGRWKQNGSVTELREYFHGWHQEVNEITNLVDERHLFRWGLFYHARMNHSWSQKRIVLLGDAIHTTMPFLAQGAALAIEDAVAIANRMKACSMNVQRTIDSFVKYRKKRVERIQSQSERMGVVYHLDFPWSLIRDWCTTWAVTRLAKEIYRYESH